MCSLPFLFLLKIPLFFWILQKFGAKRIFVSEEGVAAPPPNSITIHIPTGPTPRKFHASFNMFEL